MTEADPFAVGTEALSWPWPSPDAVAAGALEAGMRNAAEVVGGDPRQVHERLRQGDPTIRQRYQFGMAQHVAEALAAIDESIKAVYLLDYDPAPADVSLCEPSTAPRIHLVVWAQRRSHALSALASAIDRALAYRYRAKVCAPALQSLLDVQLVDDNEVQQRRGYGAMLTAVRRQPPCLWKRESGV